MNDWQKAKAAAAAESKIEDRAHWMDYAEKARRLEPWSADEYRRMEGMDGESRWRG